MSGKKAIRCAHCAKTMVHELPLRLDTMGYILCPCGRWTKVRKKRLPERRQHRLGKVRDGA